MKEKLEALGWHMYYKCNTCGGQKQYFSHSSFPGYEIRCKLKYQTFSIILNNHHVGGPYWGYQIEAKLAEHGIKN